MKIGRATHEDIDAACSLIRYLSSLDDGYMPSDVDQEEPTTFDWENKRHLQDALKLMLGAYRSRPAGLERIVWGFSALIDAEMFDPSVSHLATHPDLGKRLLAEDRGSASQANPDSAALQALQAGLDGWLRDRMKDYSDAQYGKGTVRALLAASKSAPSDLQPKSSSSIQEPAPEKVS